MCFFCLHLYVCVCVCVCVRAFVCTRGCRQVRISTSISAVVCLSAVPVNCSSRVSVFSCECYMTVADCG